MMATTSLLNRVPVAILSSRLHPLMSGKRLVLAFTGRRTGRWYATPVNYLQRDRELLVTTDSRWWRNIDGGAAVEVLLRGRRVAAWAVAVLDPEVVAEALTALISDHPPYGRWAHVKVIEGRPDPADVRAEVARGRVLVRMEVPEGIGIQ